MQLPFSVIYIGKGKSRPELSARYLIRHLFSEEILVKSNVYGNVERGVLPLDSNRIAALRGMHFVLKMYSCKPLLQFIFRITSFISHSFIAEVS